MRVMLVDSDPNLVNVLQLNFEARGHEVIGAAGSVATAREVIDGVAKRTALGEEDVGLDVAVVEANLTTAASDGAEGEEVTRYIRQKLGTGVLIFGLAWDGMVRGANANVPKRNFNGLFDLMGSLQPATAAKSQG